MNNWVTRRLLAVFLSVATTSAAFSEDAPKLPVPDAATAATDSKNVASIYKTDLESARNAPEKVALANKFLAMAAEPAGKPSEQYALCSKAIELCIQAGDARMAFVAVDAIANRFAVEMVTLESDTLAKLSATMRNSPDQNAFIQRCDMSIDRAILAERLDIARKVAELALSAARKAGDPAAQKWANARHIDVRTSQTAFDKNKIALQTLAKNKSDPAANLAVGKYNCFIKDDWKVGLEYLSKGSDVQLRSAAEAELAAPVKAEAVVEVADKWWDLAAHETNLSQKRIQHHAASLYSLALPTLSGLQKSEAEQRSASFANQPTLLNAHGMSLNEVMARFTFPNKTFHITGDCITGTSSNCDNRSGHIMLTTPESMKAFEFGCSIRAKWYHMGFVEIDGQLFLFSRGHWSNSESVMSGGKTSETRVPGRVKSPTDWGVIKAKVADTTVTWFYNGELMGTCNIREPMKADTKVKVGFSSSDTEMSVKDVYLLEK